MTGLRDSGSGHRWALRTVIDTDYPVRETLDCCVEIAERLERNEARWSDATTLLAHLRVLRDDLDLTRQDAVIIDV